MVDARTASDPDLVRRLHAGDESAFAALYSRLGSGVYRFALRMSGSPALAEDVTQEVFLALIREPGRFDAARGSLASFLYGVARNHVLRRLERERPYLPLHGSGIARAGPPEDADALADLLRRERAGLVWRALLALAPHYREAVVLCDLECLTYDQAARALDCAVGTVRSRLHRGREMLGERLRSLARASPAEARSTRRETRDAL
jgi:RNA polymerase sigma-70 factor (ECF subfamily)